MNSRHTLHRPTAETRRLLDVAMAHVRSVPYRVSLRWLFYRLLQDGLFSGKSDYGRAKDIFARARLSFFEGWRPDTLADDTREAVVKGRGYATPTSWANHYSETILVNPDHWMTQPRYVEVWFEARAMQAQFEHYVNEYVTLMAFGGDTTIAPKWETATRLARAWKATHAPIRVLYFGDDDPKGHEIPRNAWQDIHPWLELQAGGPVDAEIIRVGLNPSDGARLGIPENFEHPGTYQWEALPDDQAGEIIRGTDAYLDLDALVACDEEEEGASRVVRQALKAITF